MRIYTIKIILVIFINFCILLNGQTLDIAKIISNTQGIKQAETTFYEVEGHSIFVHSHKLLYNKKGINKIRKIYSISKHIEPSTDSSFPTNKVFTKTERRTAKVTETMVYYLFPEAQKSIRVIGIKTLNKPDTLLVKFLVRSILENSLPDSIYAPMNVDFIYFAGRYITLGPACHWMGTHNIQCPYMGQMNWAEFRSLEKAKAMVESQYDITEQKWLGKFIQQDTIDIIFEGRAAKALKTKYKINIPQLFMGGSNVLIIYYVATEVRGKYVACILSHYENETNINGFPPLLNEVMQLKP